MVRVTVPRGTRISVPILSRSTKRDVRIKGQGRFAGFALIEEGYSVEKATDDRVSAAIVGGRLPQVASSQPVLLNYEGDPSLSTYKIPAGDYVLYLLADGKPVEVTLNLEGLKDFTRTLHPTKPVDYKVSTPEPDLDLSDAHAAYSAGDHGRLSSDGLLFDLLWERRSVHAHTEYWACYYEGAPDPGANPAPYGPGCPSLNEGSNFRLGGTYLSSSTHNAVVYGGGIFSPGVWAQGVSTVTAGTTDQIDWAGIWLSFP